MSTPSTRTSSPQSRIALSVLLLPCVIQAIELVFVASLLSNTGVLSTRSEQPALAPGRLSVGVIEHRRPPVLDHAA